MSTIRLLVYEIYRARIENIVFMGNSMVFLGRMLVSLVKSHQPLTVSWVLCHVSNKWTVDRSA